MKLIFEQKEELAAVVALNEKGFQTKLETSGKVFVHGREVNDFHVVDYEALCALNISATQALVSRINDLEGDVQLLKEENEAQSSENDALHTPLDRITAALAGAGIAVEK